MVRPPACASRAEDSAAEDGNGDTERERQLRERDGARSDVPKEKEEARRRRWRRTKREKREVG